MSDIKSLKGKERLLKEYDKLTNDPDINNCFGIDYWDPDADNPDIFHWQITLIPPIGTDYEGGFFKIEAKFRDDYPNSAPQMKFVTRIDHCNVDEKTGHICINSIKSAWNHNLSMEDVLNHIMILLYKQNPSDPFNSSAANLYEKKDKSELKEKVKQSIKDYANINDYEDLRKQGIPLFSDCHCYWCGKIFRDTLS